MRVERVKPWRREKPLRKKRKWRLRIRSLSLFRFLPSPAPSPSAGDRRRFLASLTSRERRPRGGRRLFCWKRRNDERGRHARKEKKKAWRRLFCGAPRPRLSPTGSSPRKGMQLTKHVKCIDFEVPERCSERARVRGARGGNVRAWKRFFSLCFFFFTSFPRKKRVRDERARENLSSHHQLSFSPWRVSPSAMDPHPATTAHHRPPAAIELSNASTFVELLSALPPPVAPVPGGVPRPPSAIGDAAAVERLSGDGAALARMRAALAGVRQVSYMCVCARRGRERERKERQRERKREGWIGSSIDRSWLFDSLLFFPHNQKHLENTTTAARSEPPPWPTRTSS